MVEGHDVEKTGMSLDEMVNKEGKDRYGRSWTPLAVSILEGHTTITTYLVEECKADGSGTPLVLTCEKGRLEDVHMLVEGHDVEKTGMSLDEMVNKEGKDSNGRLLTPLAVSILQGNTDITAYLVKECKADGGGLLLLACEKGRLEDVRMLVEEHDVEKTGMSLNEMVNKEGKDRYGRLLTPLA